MSLNSERGLKREYRPGEMIQWVKLFATKSDLSFVTRTYLKVFLYVCIVTHAPAPRISVIKKYVLKRR